ncbi:MAG: hypothetical protein JXB49_19390 [Bacteroidales bacterium]|nr:hypothetical protein [Bacteroidales bacterium]
MKKLFARYRDTMMGTWDSNTEGKDDGKDRQRLLYFTLLSLFAIMLIIGIIISNFKSIVRNIERQLAKDKMHVICHKGINCDEVKVTWTLSVFETVTVYENGEQLFSKTNETGEQIFTIFYKNKEVAEISQFKAKDWVSHDYYFGIYRNRSDKLRVKVIIKGEHNQFAQYYCY